MSAEDGAKTLQGDTLEAAIATAEGEFIDEDLENDPVDQQCTEQCKPVRFKDLREGLAVT